MNFDENKKDNNISLSRKQQRQNVMQMLYQMDLLSDFSAIDTVNLDETLKGTIQEITLENCDNFEDIQHIKSLIRDFFDEKLDENFELSDFLAQDDKIVYEISGNCDFTRAPLQDVTDKVYIKLFIFSFLENKDEIDFQIKSILSDKWSINRLSKIDLALIRTAVTEIKYLDIPYKVAINEALELAKKYSDEKSSSFINGILKDYVKNFVEEM